jgi:hypothetical protein
MSLTSAIITSFALCFMYSLSFLAPIQKQTKPGLMRVGEVRLVNGRVVKGTLESELLSLKTVSGDQASTFCILPSSSIRSIKRSLQKADKLNTSTPRFVITNDEARIICLRAKSEELQDPILQQRVLSALRGLYDDPPPKSENFFGYMVELTEKVVVFGDEVYGRIDARKEYLLAEGVLRIRKTDGTTLTVAADQLVSFTQQGVP